MSHLAMEDQNLVEKMIGRQLVYQGNPYQLWLDELQLPNGSEISRMHLHHPGGVAVLALDDQNRCAMVRQYRHPIAQVTLEIPAGKLDSVGEDPLDCAVRELREETGLAAQSMTHLTTILTTPGFCTEKIAIYLAQGLSQGETHPDEDEFLGLIRMPLEEAFERVMRGEIHDSKTICGLMMAREAVARRKP